MNERTTLELVSGRPVLVVYPSGGTYGPGSDNEEYDLQKTYVEQVLGFSGFTDIRTIAVEPTLMGGPELARERDDQGIVEASQLAAIF